MSGTHQAKGLQPEEVLASRARHGSNRLAPPKRESWWRQYLEKFDDPVIRILLIAAGLALAVGCYDGSYWEGLGIILAVLLATTLAFVNEYRAAREFELLNQVGQQVPIKTIRAGVNTPVPLGELVVGDLVRLEAGDEVPADGRVLEAVSLHVDESRLTGESEAVDKAPAAAELASDANRESAFPRDQVFRGSLVTDGYGLVELTAVGDHTEIGRTARVVAEEVQVPSPLDRQLDRLSRMIGVIGFGLSAVTLIALVGRAVAEGELRLETGQSYFAGLAAVSLIVGLIRIWVPMVLDGFELLGLKPSWRRWFQGDSLWGWLAALLAGGVLFGGGIFAGIGSGILPSEWRSWMPLEEARLLLEFFMVAATIIVVAVPEGLAMSVTLSLAYSMRRMLATNNLVRRLSACETIGAATVICSDKTGTLTRHQMRVQSASFPLLGERQVLEPSANTAGSSEAVIAEALAANSTAQLTRRNGLPAEPLGNPTEGALLLWLEEQGLDYVPLRSRFAITYQWTFSTERKLMGTVGHSAALKGNAVHVKGAPEAVLARCTSIRLADRTDALDPTMRQAIERKLSTAQAHGMRTLAFAVRELPASDVQPSFDEVASGLVWLGFVAIADPIRAEVPAAVRACQQAGIRIKMVTGDNRVTAWEIAQQVGLVTEADGPDKAISGTDFAAMEDDQALTTAKRLVVLYRARPLDKLRLVKLLQATGEIVAVTGDGTNDASALRCAHVGLAMGKSGTAVAKEASDIILLDDSFQSIVNAITWGRALYENIQRFLLFQLTINVAALGLAFLGPFLGISLPLTVIQMLWINLIMDTFAALALATEPPHQSVMRRPPRGPEDFIITGPLAMQLFSVAAMFLAALVSLLIYFHAQGWILEHEPSWGGTVLFTVFVLVQFWNLFNAKCFGSNRSAFTRIAENRWFVGIALAILVGQVLIVQYGGRVFRTIPLALVEWLILLGGTSVVLAAGESWRWVRRRLRPA